VCYGRPTAAKTLSKTPTVSATRGPVPARAGRGGLGQLHVGLVRFRREATRTPQSEVVGFHGQGRNP
jgi:hypothetical protein